jgi:hypothetical protein
MGNAKSVDVMLAPRTAEIFTRKARVKDADIEILGLAAANIPPESFGYLKQAIRTAGHIEIEKRRFSSAASLGSNILHGLQRKLFVDDYNYAALVTGQLDLKMSDATCSNVMYNLKKLTDAELLSNGYMDNVMEEK